MAFTRLLKVLLFEPPHQQVSNPSRTVVFTIKVCALLTTTAWIGTSGSWASNHIKPTCNKGKPGCGPSWQRSWMVRCCGEGDFFGCLPLLLIAYDVCCAPFSKNASALQRQRYNYILIFVILKIRRTFEVFASHDHPFFTSCQVSSRVSREILLMSMTKSSLKLPDMGNSTRSHATSLKI